VLAAVAAVTLTVSCGTSGPAPADAPPGSAPPTVDEGYVEGAEETAEAQWRLVVADAGSGAVRVLDLITEEVVDAGSAPAAASMTGDGRFGYVVGGDGAVHVVDSGAWMVDHGDHVHYYRAPIRPVGLVAGTSPTSVHSDRAVTAVSHDDGTVTLLDRVRLDAGEVVETARVPRPPHRGTAVPYQEHVLASVARPGQDDADAVEVWNRSGGRVAAIDVACPSLEGEAVTRRGVVFGCADGALLVSRRDGAFVGEKIPYPREVPDTERAREFRYRSGSALLAARAGATGVWVLDASRKTWTHVATEPVIAVNAVGDQLPLLTLDRTGVLRAYDIATGQVQAQTPLLADPTGATIEVDSARAYVNDPSSGTIYEIDHGDALRRARTFDIGGRASHMTETGR
jgi:hypothetical protein